jgi:hypothetical protein
VADALLVLRRRWPPGRKTVRVHAITVAGFMALVQYAATRAAEVRYFASKDITGEDLVRALRLPDWSIFADLLTRGEEPGWFRRWFTLPNVRALLDASCRSNPWDRILGTLNLDPKAPPRKGSLMDDVVAVCKEVPGQSVTQVLEMPMASFLDLVESLNREALAMDPTADPDAVASEASDLASIPGLMVVH